MEFRWVFTEFGHTLRLIKVQNQLQVCYQRDIIGVHRNTYILLIDIDAKRYILYINIVKDDR